MKKFSFKSLIAGIMVGVLGITTAYAANTVASAKYKDIRVTLNGEYLDLNDPLVFITNEDSAGYAKTYMPLREILETMGCRVVWDASSETIHLATDASWIEENCIIRQELIDLGYIYSIDLEENPGIGLKWQYTVPEGVSIIVNDEGYPEHGTDIDGVVTHRFTYQLSRDYKAFPEDKPAIIFEQIMGGKKTGVKIIYHMSVVVIGKPVIYLYPEKKEDIDVVLRYDGALTFTYPEYNGGWHVTAYPDGSIVNKADGEEYSYLFWEGAGGGDFDFSKGFVVRGEGSAEFLRDTLSSIGLTPKEYNEFIVYWAPRMICNAYNLIAFQGELYTETARLEISPEPDSMLRVFMAYKPLDEFIEIEPQTFEPFERIGFTVVEWGGTEVR